MRALVLLAALHGATDRELPSAVAIEVTLPDGTLRCGEPFELAIVLRWDAALVPAPFDEEPLAALVHGPPEIKRALENGAIVETRRYQARCYQLEPLLLPPLRFAAVAPDGRGAREAVSTALERPVVGELDPADPGAIEWPPTVTTPPIATALLPWWRRGAVAAATATLVALLTLLTLRLRRRPQRTAETCAAERSLPPRAALAALLRAPPDSAGSLEPAAARAAAAALVDALRALLEAEHSLPATRRCGVELVELLPASGLPEALFAPLSQLLRSGDLAKFARAAPAADALSSLRDRAAALLRELPAPAGSERP